MTTERYDVIVVGGGNAALCAAASASENGARVLILERAPEEESGGNSRYAEIFRFAYDSVDDLLTIMPDLTIEEQTENDWGFYPKSEFYDDFFRITHYRSDPKLIELIVENSLANIQWLYSKGVRFIPNYAMGAHKIDGRWKFWHKAVTFLVGGGHRLIEVLLNSAVKDGAEIRYSCWVKDLITDGIKVTGVRYKKDGVMHDVYANSVILACGGFEANPEWRTRYLGPGWENAKVRGTRFNTGEGLAMALKIGAAPKGNWSGCHSTTCDLNAPEIGDHVVGNRYQRLCYHFGIMVNANGKRFVDEGEDLRIHTYAKFGREVLKQPGQFAWQIFDSKTLPLLETRDYHTRQSTRIVADTLEELAAKMEGVDARQLIKTIEEFNDSITDDVPFDPASLDGRRADLYIPKSNWAQTIDTGPFEAYAVTCGITFTFGGLTVDAEARVLDQDGEPIPGLFAAGEMVGGVFNDNYPGSSGLMSGTTFGRIAGSVAGGQGLEPRY